MESDVKEGSKRILWFSPTAGLWPSAELENDLANSWVEAGHRITVVRCRGVLNSYCPVMTAEGISPIATPKAKEVACVECRFNAALLDSDEMAKYSTLWLDDFVTNEISRVSSDALKSVSKENWRDLQIKGIPIGRYSSYSTLLHHKVPTPTVNDLAWSEYRSDLYNSLIVLHSMPQILETVCPELVVVYNPLYPINRAFMESARIQGIPMVSVTAGGFIPDRYSSIALYPRVSSGQTSRESITIQRSINEPLSALEISASTRQVSHQIFGNDPWVYTSAPTYLSCAQIRNRLGLRADSRVVVVLVGSPDETRSSEIVDAEFMRAESEVSNVLEFISQALSAARLMPHVDFVIRLHPRLAANKREKLDSPDLIDILSLLETCPSNAHINQAGDGIGLYDAARIARVGLNHASTSGLEFLLLGIPVVHYDPPRLNAYPPEFGRATQRFQAEELVEALSASIAGGWSIEYSLLAYRWLASTLLRALIHRNSLHVVDSENTALEESNHHGRKWSRLRELIPRFIREKVSRHQARAKRESTLLTYRRERDSNQEWKLEAAARLTELVDADIWEPLIFQRGTPLDTGDELEKIQTEVLMLISQIGGLEIIDPLRA